ncbi:MAG: formate dehydrogenase, gamma subunit [Hyphomicrobiales bacterium]|nr:formate dehydrogenase, gamma subunit [Hyphomicrobiales bacterium]
MKVTGFWAFLCMIALVLGLGLASPLRAQPAGSQPNPTADSVNEDSLFKQESKIDGRVTIPDQRSANLIQPQGREWRDFHERWLPWIAGTAILGMLILLCLFYMIRGRVRSDFSDSGGKILRFNFLERFTHWMVATCFVILALSGLNYFFGKRLLMPLMGPAAFGEFSQWAKYSHNFFAWPFTLGVLMMVVLWLRDNIPTQVDWAWLKGGGGIIGHRHVSAGRFNAGQKIVFWGVTLGGLAMFLSGLSLIFPFTLFGVNGMQLVNVTHGLIGGLFIAGILAHIYIGTLGMEGAFEAMGTGTVDIAWARQHHDLWVEGETNPAMVDDRKLPPGSTRPRVTRRSPS